MYFKEIPQLDWNPKIGQDYLQKYLPDPFQTNNPEVYNMMDANKGWFHIGPKQIYMHYCASDDPRFSNFDSVTRKLSIIPKYAAFIKSHAKVGPIHIDIKSRVCALNFPVYGEWTNSCVKFWDSEEGNYELCDPWYPSVTCGGLFRATEYHQVINENEGCRIVLSFHWDETYDFEFLCNNLLKEKL